MCTHFANFGWALGAQCALVWPKYAQSVYFVPRRSTSSLSPLQHFTHFEHTLGKVCTAHFYAHLLHTWSELCIKRALIQCWITFRSWTKIQYSRAGPPQSLMWLTCRPHTAYKASQKYDNTNLVSSRSNAFWGGQRSLVSWHRLGGGETVWGQARPCGGRWDLGEGKQDHVEVLWQFSSSSNVREGGFRRW